MMGNLCVSNFHLNKGGYELDFFLLAISYSMKYMYLWFEGVGGLEKIGNRKQAKNIYGLIELH
ncbi:MAG: hypothetical protein O4749_02200 [Trichodesmium sp. St5_bin2_1]|jgi:hypothetical protein|nr:hypothetical protein [Trichodesmium sp. St5_bin2_1]MDE5084900.1 hypothetical protein [Trichodesmium sp. St18_bin1]MDE5106080.1 hypothetical protein [Trichodesmium sp. St17_bin3_1_1]MDE5109855.1 hypothetical protein [Trichodesmium sp. St7_bin2_1]